MKNNHNSCSISTMLPWTTKVFGLSGIETTFTAHTMVAAFGSKAKAFELPTR